MGITHVAGTPCFQFFPLADCAGAQGRYTCDTALNEVMDPNEKRTCCDPNFDFTKVLVHTDKSVIPECFAEEKEEEKEEEEEEEEEKEEDENNGDESKKNEDKANDSDDSEGTSASVLAGRIKSNAHDLGLSWGGKDPNPPKKKKKGAQNPKSPPKNVRDNLKSLRNEIKGLNSRKSERVPKGWSVKQTVQLRGTKAKCKGCQKSIGYTQTCLTYRYKLEHHKFWDEIKFHSHPSCLKKMTRNQMKLFMEKNWTNKEVIEAKNMLEKDSGK